ncbi:MAG TPA: putative quinol monooxygenase [Chloroflexia bacterium]|nr:putative quinol monooxygenase [Chloroflexia bacterium]
MICLAVTYVVKPGYEEEAASALKTMSQHTRNEPGNLMYIAHRSPSDPRRFFLYEQYNDQADVDAHRAAPYFQELLANGLFNHLESRTPEFYEPL